MRAAYWAAYQEELERLDARQCKTGYGCGSSCISLAKDCQKTPKAATGKERLRRISQLAGGEIGEGKGLGRLRQTEAAAKLEELQGERQSLAKAKRAVREIRQRKSREAVQPITQEPKQPGRQPIAEPRGGRSGDRLAFRHKLVDGIPVVPDSEDLERDHGFTHLPIIDSFDTRKAAISEAKRKLAAGYADDFAIQKLSSNWVLYMRKRVGSDGMGKTSREALAAAIDANRKVKELQQARDPRVHNARYEAETPNRILKEHIARALGERQTRGIHAAHTDAQRAIDYMRLYNTSDFKAIANEIREAMRVHQEIRAGKHPDATKSFALQPARYPSELEDDRKSYERMQPVLKILDHYAAHPGSIPANVRGFMKNPPASQKSESFRLPRTGLRYHKQDSFYHSAYKSELQALRRRVA